MGYAPGLRTTCLLLLLAACGPQRFYLGPRQPSDEVARLIVVGGGIDDTRKFTAKLVRFDTLPLRHSPKESEILPGDHTIEVAWVLHALAPGPKKAWLRAGTGSETIAFEADENKVYRIIWEDGRPQLRIDEDVGE